MADGSQANGLSVSAEVRCRWCDEVEFLELFEVWGDREFQFETCCEGLHDEVVRFLNDDPRGGAELLREIGIEAITGRRLRRVADDGACSLILDWNLELDEIKLVDAKAFVRTHHEHHRKPPAGWRFGRAVRNGDLVMGVIMVGRPVARMIDHKKVVEANRLCVRRDVPDALRWNCASMLYGYAAREARRRGFEKIITYTLAEEEGTTLRASGWNCEGAAGGGSWDRPARQRQDCAPTGLKTRWVKSLA